jgi:molecular chaperone GrpE (heat shock protein)
VSTYYAAKRALEDLEADKSMPVEKIYEQMCELLDYLESMIEALKEQHEIED